MHRSDVSPLLGRIERLVGVRPSIWRLERRPSDPALTKTGVPAASIAEIGAIAKRRPTLLRSAWLADYREIRA